MKRFYMILMAMLAGICLAGCYDDKGDYDYDWISTASTTFEDSYTYTYGDALVFRPKIIFRNKENGNTDYAYEDSYKDDEYSYYWIARHYDKDFGRIVSDTIGRERNLNYIIRLEPETYLVEYQVCNKTNDIKWLGKFTLKVTLSAPEGWLFLEDNNGSAELSIYAYMGDGSMHIEKGMLAKSGIPAASLVGPRQVVATYQNQVGNGVWILTDKFTGYLNVKAGHKWTSRQVVQNHLVESVPTDFVFKRMQKMMFYTLFGFSDDGLRVSRYPGMLYTGDLMPTGEERFDLSPYLAATGNEAQTKQVLAFDDTHKCFKFLDISGDFTWMQADETFPVGYDLKLMEEVGASGSRKIYCLLNKDGAVYQQIASSSTQVEGTIKRLSNSEAFLNAEQRVYHKTTFLPYYLYGGKLYVNRDVDDDREVKYYDFSDIEEEVALEGNITYITALNFNDLDLFKHWQNFVSYLVVATELEDGTGKVYFLTPKSANAHIMYISDVVDTDHKVIGIDYQRPDI